MTILHICDGWERSNGAANIARMIADEQRRAGHDVSLARWAQRSVLRACDQVWVHCGWKPCLWWAALWGRDVHWMPEASYDPVRLSYHGWKKRLAGPVERFFLRRVAVVVAACEAEAGWIRAYEPRVKGIEVTDIKRFFKLERGDERTADALQDGKRPVHLLYLGRRHPLKGVEYLERAVAEVVSGYRPPDGGCPDGERRGPPVELRVVSDAFGDEKERVWDWCDVLVLPTLSENFALVVAEALERGKRVITTDGAPAWGGCGDWGGRLVYLDGYREGAPEDRVRLLSDAIVKFCALRRRQDFGRISPCKTCELSET